MLTTITVIMKYSKGIEVTMRQYLNFWGCRHRSGLFIRSCGHRCSTTIR